MLSHRAIITGRVQKVGYRAATQKKAKSLNIKGWVRNLDSGQVEAVYQSNDATLLAQFESWLEKGPLMAKVKSVSIEKLSEKGEETPPEGAFPF
jgi:acylphosphatase